MKGIDPKPKSDQESCGYMYVITMSQPNNCRAEGGKDQQSRWLVHPGSSISTSRALWEEEHTATSHKRPDRRDFGLPDNNEFL